MAKCKNCGSELSADGKFCENCGTPINKQICQACGGANEDSAVFCAQCGSRLNKGYNANPQGGGNEFNSSAKCKNCGSELSADGKFCENCGTPIDTQICRACGANNESQAGFCARCGSRLNGNYNANSQHVQDVPFVNENKGDKKKPRWVIPVAIAAAVAVVCCVLFAIVPKFGGGSDSPKDFTSEVTSQESQRPKLPKSTETPKEPGAMASPAPSATATIEPSATVNTNNEMTLGSLAQGYLLYVPMENGEFTQNTLDSFLYQLYTLNENYRDYLQNESPLQNNDLFIDIFQNPVPEVQAVLQGASKQDYDSGGGVNFEGNSVRALLKQLYGQDFTAEQLSSLLNSNPDSISSYSADSDTYYFPSYELTSSLAYYADKEPFPHASDNTYRMAYLWQTSDIGVFVDDITVEKNPANSFGFDIISVSAPPIGGTGISAMNYADYDFSFHPEGFVFPFSGTDYITDTDIGNLRARYADVYFHDAEFAALLGYARNEIYARHGNQFDTPKYANYFSEFDWYSPTHKVGDGELSEIEKDNIQKILEWEEYYKNSIY